jgi:triacylglycerol lipase
MSTRNTANAATHVGRVGGLAVALGVGAAVLAGFGCGTASADTSGSSPSSSSSDSSSTDSSGATKTKAATKQDPAADSADPQENTGTDTTSATHPKRSRTHRPALESGTPAPAPGPDSTVDSTHVVANTVQRSQAPKLTHATPSSTTSEDAAVTLSTASTATTASTSDTPDPAQGPATWTLLALARRELENLASASAAHRAPAANPTATSVVTDTVGDATTTAEPSPAPPLTKAQYEGAFTGTPSLFTHLEVAALQVVSSVAQVLGTSFAQLGAPLTTPSPPWFLTLGEHVKKTEIDGMPVWEVSSSHPSGEYVVAIHGGQFSLQPSILHWYDYAAMVRNTGATVVVPIYPLAGQQGGTADNVVTGMADLIEQQVQAYGSENVSVFGDSCGGGIALSAAQLLASRGETEPGSMVLVSPVLDQTFSNPNIPLAHDPLVNVAQGRRVAQQWAGGLALTDPLVSPLYGSLDGLPPTTVYSGSLSLLAPDALVLQQEAQAEHAPFTFVNASGEIEDWVIYPFGDGTRYQDQIYQELGLTDTSS